jgi:lysophospholipase L1-like esterase
MGALLSLALAAAAAPARDVEHHDRAALALGDSVAFGYVTQAGHEYVDASNFIRSPEYVAGLLDLDLANASCPGETSGSFVSAHATDNGCRAYRAEFPLHVGYAGTQLEFATKYLARHRDTRLVSIGLGANDILLLQDGCAADPDPPLCIQTALPAVLAAVGTNMASILEQLRNTGFGGVIVLVNYYSLDYSDPAATGIVQLLNQALAAPAAAYGAVIADVFQAFRQEVSGPGLALNPCYAGLLNVNPQNPALCDVHPTQSGQRLIARTISAAYHATTW